MEQDQSIEVLTTPKVPLMGTYPPKPKDPKEPVDQVEIIPVQPGLAEIEEKTAQLQAYFSGIDYSKEKPMEQTQRHRWLVRNIGSIKT
jgi:hypothetical protein